MGNYNPAMVPESAGRAWRERHDQYLKSGGNPDPDGSALAWKMLIERDQARDALRKIASMETPGANGIVRKMVAIAKEALLKKRAE